MELLWEKRQCPKFCVNDILSGRVIVEFYNPILFSNIAIN